ncbi:asparagine synthase family protein [Archaeoglobus veneficus]|uniref:Asparagine synthase n=1 Tax=Archaeoglobus veneficus (strain DSM 11195 / SNP6) TaxID=693661 RepID=F2KP39_ARCVS|nr:asparagine synthetase B [Archaeoglobus veneficus]AEA46347.1 asparagine synthase [Archaeoglobus veneficus SNP6]
MSIYAFAEIEEGKVKRINASARYPSKQSGNVFYDADEVICSDDAPLRIKGFHAIVAFKARHVFISRDVVGGKPLYYNPEEFAFSSFKSYFDTEAIELMPGEVLKLNYDGSIEERHYYSFHDVFRKEEASVDELVERIEKSLENFKPGNSCIAFSGGVDSSLLAALYDVQLINVTASREEEEHVRYAAKLLGREIEVYRFGEQEVKEVLPEVVKAIETTNPLQVSIGIPVYLAMKFAKSLGYNQVIFGQGADELFGGYKRYESLNYEELEDALLSDVKNLGKNNLVRDVKLSYRAEVKLLTPYLQWDIISAAMNIPVDLKVRREDGRVIRKYVLRKIAEKYVPKELAYRDKKAVQYSTKTSTILEKIAKKAGMNLAEYLEGL